jgi:hypothetical protein
MPNHPAFDGLADEFEKRAVQFARDHIQDTKMLGWCLIGISESRKQPTAMERIELTLAVLDHHCPAPPAMQSCG